MARRARAPIWWRMAIGLDDDAPPPEPVLYNFFRTRVIYDGWPCGREAQMIPPDTSTTRRAESPGVSTEE